VPRAKRTNRAEARRRYRASVAEPIDETADEAAAEPAAPASAARKTQAESAPRAGERPSLGYAFRAAFRPLNLGEDMRYLPKLLVHRSLWLPILLTVAAGVAVAVSSGSFLVGLIGTYFVWPPALGSVFIGGFLAPRASYLVGFLIGLAAAVVFSALLIARPELVASGQLVAGSPTPTPAASVAPSPSESASPGASASPVTSPASSASATPAASPTASPTQQNRSSLQDQIIYAFVTSPPFGLFFAASAAWYRRFLRLSRPQAAKPQQRRSDGKTRTRR
jgi:hypothetical protein